MFRTKKDVDKHVQDINSKVKNPQERILKGYVIAKLYYQVGDYESAKKYLIPYLAEKDTHVIAHKLNGQIYEALKQPEKALSAYKTCYTLDTCQKDVLETICNLLLELPIDPGRTKYWIEQTERHLPHSNILFSLKEALVSKTEGDSSAEFEAMINKELATKPQDPNIWSRLIRYYQRVGRIKDGYDKALKAETNRHWTNNLDWYRTLIEILENYQTAYRGNVGKDYYAEYLSALDSLISLEIVDRAQYSRIAELVSKMNKSLQEALQSQVAPERTLLEHFQAQFYLHTARLIYRKFTKDMHPASTREHHRTLGLALLAAYTLNPAKDLKAGSRWSFVRSAEAVRRSIAGHCLISLAERFGGLESYRERLASVSGGNAKISNLVFVSIKDKLSTEASFLLSAQYPVDLTTAEIPIKENLKALDITAQQECLSDLNILVWILLRYYSPGKVLDVGFPLPPISGIPEIPSQPYNNASELDAHCFLYAVAYTSGYAGEENQEEFLLPPYMGAIQATADQVAWWVHLLNSGKGNLSPQDNRVLQHGLEAIRCKGLHGLDVQLTLKLGKTYECHALEASATADSDEHADRMVLVLEGRAACYYKAALASIEKLESGVGLREPILRLFPAAGPDPSTAELAKMKESAKFFLACENMHSGVHDQALERFREVRSVYASFYSAEIYKKLAQEEMVNMPPLTFTSAYINHLTDARECLYLTLDRLKTEPPGHPLNATIANVLEEVENLLNRAEQGEEGVELINGVDHTDTIERLVTSTPRNRGPQWRRSELFDLPRTLSSSVAGNRSVFEEREAKPSPERLDAQIRQLNHTQDGLVRQLSSRDQDLTDAVRELHQTSKEVLLTNKDVLQTNKDVLQNNKDLLQSHNAMFQTTKEILSLLRAELNTLSQKSDRTSDLLQKILEKRSPTPSPPESTYSLSEEEKMLLESFGLGTSPAAAAAAAYSPLVNLQHHQMMLAMAAAQQTLPQRPAVIRPMPPTAALYNHQLMGAGMFPNPMGFYGVQLPTVPVAPVPELLPAAPFTPTQPAGGSVVNTMSTPIRINKPVESGTPTNVVISKSDKIPTVAPPAVSMSVTVPLQYRFGTPSTPILPIQPSTPVQSVLVGTPLSVYKTPASSNQQTPHGFQIALPTSHPRVPISPFNDSDSPAVPITTQALLRGIPTPVYSAVTPSPEKGISTSATKTRMYSGGTPKGRQPSVGEEPEEYEPEVDFKPVVPLPEEIEVVTGEEDEEVLFEDRAKLFRYSDDVKEWKERGLGQAKILKNRESGRVRFLMRRDQTFKICANHAILPEMKMELMKGNTKARIWGAHDFADGETKTEKFCIKMKTEEQIEKFHGVFESAAKSAASVTKKLGAKTDKTPASKSLADFAAAQKSGSWECGACLTRNDNAKIQCLACEGAKPGCEEEVKKLKEAAKPAAVMTIGATGGFSFGGMKFGESTPSSGTQGFTFGTPSSAASTGFSFGTPKSQTEMKEESPKPPFGTKDKHEFSFSGLRTSPRKHNESTTSENELYREEDEEADGIYFEPVIPLPDKVEVRTGEEEEEVLYSHKAKLYRYTDAEWKERGIGDIKILRHTSTGKIRLLMRREQVLKICLNHYMTPQLLSALKEKDTKSWTWAAQDFSDGELTNMMFALRFKTPDISSDFKSALDSAVGSIGSSNVVEVRPASPASAKESKTESKPSMASAGLKYEQIYKVEDFKPLEAVDKENELTFEGLGLKLNTATDAKDVVEKIGQTKSMHVLTLAGNTVGIDAARAIGEALEKHTEFRRAHWKDMFTGRMKTEIPPALINLTRGIMVAQARLVELDLSDNAFGPIGMEGLTTFLKSPSCFTLQELRLNNTGCGVTGGKLLAATLLEAYHRSKEANHPLALRVFVLGRSRQENEGATALAEVFKLMGSLEEVVMPQNGIYFEGLTALADAFSNNPNLRILNLNDNTFTDKGARAMAKTLKKLNNLEVLNLGDCLLKSAGAKLISRALKNRHPNLKELVLDSNEIRISGGLEIVDAVTGKTKLELLSIDGNWFGGSGEKTLRKKLEQASKLEVLQSMEDNEEPDEDEADPELEAEDEDEKVAATPKQAGSIFSGSSATPILGTSTPANLFGGSSQTTSVVPSGLFGTPSSESKPSMFGAAVSESKPSIFGGTPIKSSNSLFGGAKSTVSMFGGGNAATLTAPTSSSIFGGNGSGAVGLFGKPDDSPCPALFGKPIKEKSDKPDSTSDTTPSVFSSSSVSGFSFASLAADTEKSGFGFGSKTEGFKFQGAGTQLFGGPARKPTARDTSKNDDEEEDGSEDDGHDPHFEPIVPLPELVNVRTGEEEEEVIFKHRAKVYRFDTDLKEWKERGVGDIKILKHSVRGTFRVLLRRDQVHKIACNHLINREMALKPLASSETAWCWFAMDYSEGYERGSVDQLAVRFKTKDTAIDFKTRFEDCQKQLPEKGSASTPVASEPSVKQQEESHEEAAEEDNQEGEAEEYYGEDEDETAAMFEAEGRLWIKAEGGNWEEHKNILLRIIYDDDVYGARLMARYLDDEEEEPSYICDHMIAVQTNLGDDLSWSALDFSAEPAEKKFFRAEFDSEETVNDFRDTFAQGKEFAEECEIMENPRGEEVDPRQFYYGVGGD